MNGPDAGAGAAAPAASAWQVFLVFLKLGLTSFGGPVAHLGYFRTEFVERRRWVDESRYADLVALCQFLPGPASSQVGFAVGLSRAGWAGALAAWAGFTLPSALLLIAFAHGVAQFRGLADSGAVHGLQVVAVAVVAQAVWGMAKSLCPDRLRAGFAIAAALAALALPSAAGQVGAMVVCAALGWWLLKLPPAPPAALPVQRVSKRAGLLAFALFAALLIGLPLWAAASAGPLAGLVSGAYRAGALVFGGGHVVLPLLQDVAVRAGGVSDADFLAGYGAAQAVPGPLFTFAAYLGALMPGPWPGWAGGLAFLLVVFLPALLLVVAAMPFWDVLRPRAGVQCGMAGVHAAVVGLLLAALYDPVWTSAIHSRADFGLALAAFGLLVVARWSPVAVVALAALAGWLLAAS